MQFCIDCCKLCIVQRNNCSVSKRFCFINSLQSAQECCCQSSLLWALLHCFSLCIGCGLPQRHHLLLSSYKCKVLTTVRLLSQTYLTAAEEEIGWRLEA